MSALQTFILIIPYYYRDLHVYNTVTPASVSILTLSRIKCFEDCQNVHCTEYSVNIFRVVSNKNFIEAVSNNNGCVPVIHGMFTNAFTYQFMSFIVQECVV